MHDPTYARLNNIVVVIRAAGERTFDACRAIVQDQIAEERIRVVRERPFEAALKRSYEIGISEGTKWLMTLDADVLLRQNAIIEFYKQAEKMPNRFFQVEGLVHDKMTGLYRKAGHRMYRTRYLDVALKQIPKLNQEVRPEYATLQKMESIGYPSLELNMAFGIHDYEQFYCDIYRKAFLHANKHQFWLPQLIAQWKEKSKADNDFKVALMGLWDGLLSTDEIKLDTDIYTLGSEKVLHKLGIQEKSQLSPNEFDCRKVESIIQSTTRQVVKRKQRSLGGITRRLKGRYKRLGALRFGPYLLGSMLCDLGNVIKGMAENKISYRL